MVPLEPRSPIAPYLIGTPVPRVTNPTPEPIGGATAVIASPMEVTDSEGRSRQRYVRAGLGYAAIVGARAVSFVIAIVTIPLTLPYLGPERFGLWMTINSFGGAARIRQPRDRAKSDECGRRWRRATRCARTTSKHLQRVRSNHGRGSHSRRGSGCRLAPHLVGKGVQRDIHDRVGRGGAIDGRVRDRIPGVIAARPGLEHPEWTSTNLHRGHIRCARITDRPYRNLGSRHWRTAPSCSGSGSVRWTGGRADAQRGVPVVVATRSSAFT